MKKEWSVTAYETLVHSWTIEAETEEEAREIAGSGCPMPDGDCESVEFEITKVKLEDEPTAWIIPTFRLEAFIDQWAVVARGLSQEEALERSKEYLRFKIVPEVQS